MSNPYIDTRRHMELFNPETFTDNINIIGAGATGSWLALIFAKLGVKGQQIHVWDFDNVEEHNIANQIYTFNQVGEPKVEALYNEIMEQTNTQINVKNQPFERGRLNGYVFMMIDTMAGRKQIWNDAIKLKSAIKHYVEPRMGLDMGRIYNVDPMNLTHIEQYEQTLYSDEEAEVSACGTSQSVITSAMGIASYCARQLINHVNGVKLDNEILIDFMHNNLITSKWEG